MLKQNLGCFSFSQRVCTVNYLVIQFYNSVKSIDVIHRVDKRWMAASEKCQLVLVLSQEKASTGFILKPTERPYVPLKDSTSDF